jgi:putative oxidoreductase
MRYVAPAARVLYGLIFLVFAANYFVPFLPPNAPPPDAAMAFAGALAGSGLLGLIKVIELAAAVALLANRFVPLALAVLAPIVVGITFFHVVLAPVGIPIVVFVLALELGLAWKYRSAFAPMLRAKVEPAPVASSERAPSLATH